MLKRHIVFVAAALNLCMFSQASLASYSASKVASITASSIENEARYLASKAKNLNPYVVKLALTAYFSAKQQGVNVRKPIITIADYSLSSGTKRLWVIDLANQQILYNSLVAHGKYSGGVNTTEFSNQSGSQETSLGLFLTGNTYIGHRGYTLVIKGLDRGFNDRAESRRVVMHGAPYVTEDLAKSRGTIGRSWGCPAIEPNLAVPVINTIKDGSLFFSYYPNKTWLGSSRYLKGSYSA